MIRCLHTTIPSHTQGSRRRAAFLFLLRNLLDNNCEACDSCDMAKYSDKPKHVAPHKSKVAMPNQNNPKPIVPFDERDKYPKNFRGNRG